MPQLLFAIVFVDNSSRLITIFGIWYGEGRTTLCLACANSPSDVALEILKRDIVDMNAKDSDDWTALTRACASSHSDVALEIQRLAKGIDRSLAALFSLAANQFEECPNAQIGRKERMETSHELDQDGRNAKKRVGFYLRTLG